MNSQDFIKAIRKIMEANGVQHEYLSDLDVTVEVQKCLERNIHFGSSKDFIGVQEILAEFEGKYPLWLKSSEGGD